MRVQKTLDNWLDLRKEVDNIIKSPDLKKIVCSNNLSSELSEIFRNYRPGSNFIRNPNAILRDAFIIVGLNI